MSLFDEWQELCREHEKARDAYMKALGVIDGSFSEGNRPEEIELNEFDKTWDEWQDVTRRMSEFLNKHR